MHALPFLLSLTCALVLAPALVRRLTRAGASAANYRGRQLPCPFGLLIALAALLAALPLVALAQLAHVPIFYGDSAGIALYTLGVAALGLLDDALGSADIRGLRGHAAAALRGELSTGLLKAGGSIALALLALGALGRSGPRLLLATAVLVLCTHVFNLLDLRPGRAIKAFVLLGAALTALSAQLRPLWSLGLFAGPALVAGGWDLGERAMLGDTGAGVLGALGGLWLVLSLDTAAQALALSTLAAITLFGEMRSISRLIERTPGLRALDSLGRPS